MWPAVADRATMRFVVMTKRCGILKGKKAVIQSAKLVPLETVRRYSFMRVTMAVWAYSSASWWSLREGSADLPFWGWRVKARANWVRPCSSALAVMSSG